MRDLAGGEEEAVGDDALRVRTDGGGRLVGVNDLRTCSREMLRARSGRRSRKRYEQARIGRCAASP